MHRRDLSDQQWARLAPILPALKPHTGHPHLDHRPIFKGLLWINRTGAPGRSLPERSGQWQTVSSRFYRWQQTGIGQRILDKLPTQADRQGQLDWAIH
jgi:transposase